MRTILSLRSFATHATVLAAVTLPVACASAPDDPEIGGADPVQGQTAPLHSPPAADNVEPFSVTPEGASAKDGYWVSSVGFDAARKPVLLDAYQISEAEMLEQSAKLNAAFLADKEQTKVNTEGGSWGAIDTLTVGTSVACGTSAANNSLIFTDGTSFTGNRICIQGGGNLDWFRLYNWYWFLGQPNQERISGNIASYGYSKRFFIEAWVDNTIKLSPTTWTGATDRCFSVAPTNCGNPNGCTSGGGQNANARGQCGQYITWLFI